MIQIKGVSKTFQNEKTIKYKDMIFEDGKSYMLLGASGCGKSTLLNMISGILSPDGGEILIDGLDIVKCSQKEKDKQRINDIGYIFQDFKLIPEMTVADNIAILRLEGIDISRMDEVLSSLCMLEYKNKKVKYLSGGQKQRVAIARAIVKTPKIILADEPTGNLNFEIGQAVVKELSDATKGKTLIAVTHDERLACYFDCVINMDDMTGGEQDA